MTYKEIFAEVVDIMLNDSATCKDFGIGEAEKYEQLIQNNMNEKDFTYTVKKYIASFGLEGHLDFRNTKMGHLDFEVMRYEDRLYVTEAAAESNLKKGDAIVAIDGKSIDDVALENSEFLMKETNERQGILWDAILLFAKEVTVSRGTQTLKLAVVLGQQELYPEKYSYCEIDSDTLLLKLKDFADENEIRNLYESCKDKMDSCKNLIIDVRHNDGGADTAFMPLLEYCYPAGKTVDEFLPKSEPVAINYSKRNCDIRLKMLDQFFGDEIPEDVRPIVEAMKSQLLENQGKGFIADENQEDEIGIVVRQMPQKVWILTDQNCLSSGEAFVQIIKYSPKVEIVGRPTLGILDYSNCASVALDDFVLFYPTSRDGSIDKDHGMFHKGIQVDHYIPWTPEFLSKDLDLEFVMNQI